jgi:hypothetical protein
MEGCGLDKRFVFIGGFLADASSVEHAVNVKKINRQAFKGATGGERLTTTALWQDSARSSVPRHVA